MYRFYLAFLCFFRVLFGKPLPEQVLPPPPEVPKLPPPERAPEPAPRPKPQPEARPAAPPTLEPGALQLLSMLQRDGRLVDFLRESLDGVDDADIGQAVREIHRGCRKVLEEHFTVEPVVPDEEGGSYHVDEGFDKTSIRLTGNVTGKPPFDGVLRHHGWRVTKVKLPEVTAGVDQRIVAPAEVELP